MIPAQDPQQTFFYQNAFVVVLFSVGGPPMPSNWPTKGAKSAKPASQASPTAKAVKTPFCFMFYLFYRLQQINRPLFRSHSHFGCNDVYISQAASTLCLGNTVTVSVPPSPALHSVRTPTS